MSCSSVNLHYFFLGHYTNLMVSLPPRYPAHKFLSSFWTHTHIMASVFCSKTLSENQLSQEGFISHLIRSQRTFPDSPHSSSPLAQLCPTSPDQIHCASPFLLRGFTEIHFNLQGHQSKLTSSHKDPLIFPVGKKKKKGLHLSSTSTGKF